MARKVKNMIIDIPNTEPDANGCVYPKEMMMKAVSSRKVLPVFLNSNAEQQVGTAKIEWDSEVNAITAKFSIDTEVDTINKYLSPCYKINGKNGLRVTDGKKHIVSAKIVSLNLSDSHTCPDVLPIRKK